MKGRTAAKLQNTNKAHVNDKSVFTALHVSYVLIDFLVVGRFPVLHNIMEAAPIARQIEGGKVAQQRILLV
jgi:hypothetical protein